MENIVLQLEPSKFARAAEILKAISSPYRLEIINFLEDGQFRAVKEIQAEIGIEATLLSHHLAKMRDKGILTSFRKGRFIYYKLAVKELVKILDCINKCDFL